MEEVDELCIPRPWVPGGEVEPLGVWGCLLESARLFKEARGAAARPEEAFRGEDLKDT